MKRFGFSGIFLRVSKTEYLHQKVENAMDVFYRANVTDGLFHEQWLIEDGTPSGSKFIHELNYFKPHL